MNYLQIQNESTVKLKKTPVKDFLLKVLDKLGKDKWEVSVLFTGDAFIQQLNGEYRGKDEPTDVLSFAQVDNKEAFPEKGGRFYAGDIVISMETLAKNADYFGIAPAAILYASESSATLPGTAITSFSFMSLTALSDISSGSPGPTPTPYALPFI